MDGWIPKPPELAGRIAADAARRVKIDEAALVPAVRELMGERPDDSIWIAAEESALSVLRDQWCDEFADDIGRALADVHEDYLASARCVEQVLVDLEENGLRAWATKAILAQFAFDIAFDLVAEEESV